MDPKRTVRAPSRPGLGALVLGIAVGFAATALLSALLAPAAYALVETVAPGSYPFQRVFRRLTMLVALIVLAVGLRAAGVRRLADLGLAWSATRGWAALRGVAWGAAAIATVFAAELTLGRRGGTPERLSPLVIAEAAGAGAAVGLLEEAVCRGALLFPFGPMSGAALAAANTVTSSLYATAHFLRGGGRETRVDAWSGFRLWGELPGALGDHVEAWVGLFLTGGLLYLLAARQGHAWGATGVHAGSVFALKLLGTGTEPVPGAEAIFFVDGLLPGWGLSALLALALGTLLALRPRTGVAD